MIKLLTSVKEKYFDSTVEFSKLSKTFLLWAFGLVLVYVGNIYITRLTGLELYGKYTVFINWILLVSTVVVFGWDGYFIQKIPHLQKDGNGKIYGKALLRNMAFSCLLLYAVFAAAGLLLYKNGIFFKTTTEVLFFCAFVFLFTGISLSRSFLKVFNKITSIQLLEDGLKPLVLLMVILFFYINGLQLTLNKLYIINLLVFAVVFFYMLVVLLTTYRANFSGVKLQPAPGKWANSCFYFMCIYLGYTVFTKMELLFLGYFSKNEAAAQFQILLRITDLVILPDFLFNYFLPQKFAAHFANQNIGEAKKLFRNSAKTIFLLQLLCLAGVSAIGYFYLKSFNIASGYMYVLLVVLSSSQIFYAMFGSANLVLKTSGNEKYSFYALVIILSIEFIADAVFINRYGITAAVIIAWLSVMAYTLLLSFFVHKKLGINTSVTKTLFFKRPQQ